MSGLALALSLVCFGQLRAGVFTPTGSLNAARELHTASSLANGKVLVAGGITNLWELSSAELYDPDSEAWVATSLMNTARAEHTATSLPNGKVLVAGGLDINDVPLTSAELYDPAVGIWRLTGDLNAPRAGHTATLLPNGKVLVAGGYDGIHALASAELYDPAAGTWSQTSDLNIGRESHTATLLPNGKVLVAGGVYFGFSRSSAELYDPVSNAWVLTGDMADERFSHTATLLPNGQVLIAGGQIIKPFLGNVSLSGAELYDPATGSWSATASLSIPRCCHTATLLPNGRVLVGAGYYQGFGNWFLLTAEEYDPAGGTWTPTANHLAVARQNHTATLLPSGKVLISGGMTSNGNWDSTDEAELYDPGIPSNPAPEPARLADAQILRNGLFQFTFTNTPAAPFSVLASSFLALPTTEWMVLGGVTETSPGHFQFTDLQTTNYQVRFYRLRSP